MVREIDICRDLIGDLIAAEVADLLRFGVLALLELNEGDDFLPVGSPFAFPSEPRYRNGVGGDFLSAQHPIYLEITIRCTSDVPSPISRSF